MELEVIKLTLEETLLFYSNPEKDKELGCIGHLRGDFGHKGKEFWHSWFDHQSELNTPEFKADIASVMERLKKDLLKNYGSMANYCYQHREARMEGAIYPEMYGFRLNTDHYRYYIRCSLQMGDYNFYVYCYKNEKERLHVKQRAGRYSPLLKRRNTSRSDKAR
jgi:hypothetical protein